MSANALKAGSWDNCGMDLICDPSQGSQTFVACLLSDKLLFYIYLFVYWLFDVEDKSDLCFFILAVSMSLKCVE